jgi:hypothetical protein
MADDDERDDDATPARGLFRQGGDETLPPLPPPGPRFPPPPASYDSHGTQGGAPPGPAFGEVGAQPPGPHFDAPPAYGSPPPGPRFGEAGSAPPGPSVHAAAGYQDRPDPWLDDIDREAPPGPPFADTHWLLDDDQSGLQVPLGGPELPAEPIPGPADDLREPWLRKLLRKRRER